MKKRAFLLPFLLLSTLGGLTACSDDEHLVQLSYGSLVDTETTQINYSTLTKMVSNEESFILILRPGLDSEITCSCWRTFSTHCDSYVQDHTRILYEINIYNVSDQEETFGLEAPTSQDPGFAVFENGQLVKQYFYTAKSTPTYWTNVDALASFLDEITEEPKLIYIDESMLETKILNSESFIITYTWSSCSDCAYVLPNVLDPYAKSHDLDEDIYLIDLEVEGLLLVDGTKDNTNENYLAFLKKYGISEDGSSKYGYSPVGDSSRGYVPTTQYYRNGILKDADVFFNDTVSVNDNGEYYVSHSFFSEDRIQYLGYVDNVETSVLEGMILSEDQVIVYEYTDADGVLQTYVYWESNAAATYHTPLLEAFLDTYAN